MAGKALKLIILTPNYPRKNATMNGIFIHQQVKALISLGVECHVLLPYNWYPPFGLHRLHSYWREGRDQHIQYYEAYEGVPIHSIPVFVKMPSRLFREDYYTRVAKALSRYIKKHNDFRNADWLYAHFLTDFGYIGTKVKALTGIRLAAIARGDDVHAWPQQWPSLVGNIEEVMRKADIVLANSNRLAQDVLRFKPKGIHCDVKVIYNGVNTDLFNIRTKHITELRTKLGLPLDDNIILSIGTMIRAKGWLEVLDAIQLLSNNFSNYYLIIISDNYSGKDRLDITSEILKRGLKNKVLTLFNIAHSDIYKYYNAADLYLSASYNEGLSNAILEACSSGLPVIATNVGGHAEVLTDQAISAVIEPMNSSHIYENVIRLIKLKESYPEFNYKIRAMVEENIGDYKMNAQKLIELLN